METSERSHLIIPNIFPAKLWHLVNHPDVTAIVWDSKGKGIKVHQELLEKQILSPNTNTLTCCNNFRGITFSSFIRQLYAYGFKKAEHCKRYQTEIHYYFHPHFNKNKPELLSLMCRSAPKYRRTVPFFPERETLPEKGTEKVVIHGRCDIPTEANVYRGNHLHHYPFKPVPLTHMVTRVQPQFPRRNCGGGGPPHVSNMLPVPGANYHTVIVPTNSSLMHPLYFQQGNPNVFPHPDCYVQVVGGYPQNHVAPRFFNPVCYKMGYRENMYEVPAAKPMVVSQHVQITASPPASLPETEPVNTESISSSRSFHVPSISGHSNTPTTSKHINSPTPKADKSPEDSTGKAAELLLFLSGQEPNNNPQDQTK